ncbi:hypothetical protein BV25DRAFT_1545720 [Artomyces pyxidatus]|uniref:Uncharacterized protein n=1 Tax=Artomyces pyxidatus TaxID=48021 RepID=A0ACB8SJU8_9AGAM|nr:hypothetical protein BV25DRAFT_1545720 [Artomyces pyxidatus]
MPVPTFSYNDPSAFAVLGLAPDASGEDIKVAYKKLALQWHPDRNQHDKETATRRFVEIHDAYDFLMTGSHSAASGNDDHTPPTQTPGPRHADMPEYSHPRPTKTPSHDPRFTSQPPHTASAQEQPPPRRSPATRYATIPDEHFTKPSPGARHAAMPDLHIPRPTPGPRSAPVPDARPRPRPAASAPHPRSAFPDEPPSGQHSPHSPHPRHASTPDSPPRRRPSPPPPHRADDPPHSGAAKLRKPRRERSPSPRRHSESSTHPMPYKHEDDRRRHRRERSPSPPPCRRGASPYAGSRERDPKHSGERSSSPTRHPADSNARRNHSPPHAPQPKTRTRSEPVQDPHHRRRSRSPHDHHRRKHRTHDSRERSPRDSGFSEYIEICKEDLPPAAAELLQPAAPAAPGEPPEWVFPIELTLEELYRGTTRHFRIASTEPHKGVSIAIPPGTRAGARVRVPDSVTFEVRCKPHACFDRVGKHDLAICVELPWTGAPFPAGSAVAFAGVCGEEVRVDVPRSLVEGTEGAKVRGRGMPICRDGKVVGYGDLYIRWDFFVPGSKEPSSKWSSIKNMMRFKF